MKKIFYSKYFIVFAFLLLYSISAKSQACAAGYTRDTLNWDNFDFLPNTGTYVTPTAWITLAQSQTQKFTYGTQIVTVTHNYSGANDPGENFTNTARTGSYGNGGAVQFIGNGVITITYATAVQNVKFSVYDIDQKQKVAITAKNGATSQNVTMAKISGTVLTIAGSGTATASATASATNVANTSTDGAINVDITGPITTITLTVTVTGTASGEDGSFWLGDISACNPGSFSSTYWSASKPYTGMPSYVLVVNNGDVYYSDVATGNSKLLFSDPSSFNINSVAYDPVRHMVYYTYTTSGSGGTLNQNDITVRRYDYDMDTLGVVMTNVHAWGIPTYEEGVESGSAGFFNGSLFLGIEEADNGRTSNRKHTIWRVDFNASYAATTISQTVSYLSDDGAGNLLYDWGDIGINNGIIYSFNAASGHTGFDHYNMLTGTFTHYNPSPSTLTPLQTSVDWNGIMYNVGGTSGSSATITAYNNNGTESGTSKTITYGGTTLTGNWGDAGEAFKPKTDFGDAPSTYDPAGSDPAVTEEDDKLYLGTNKPGIEWAKKTSTDASGDGTEEDGITGLPVIRPGTHTFVVPVKVFNNTGSNATLIAWLDYNNNGVYEASEGRSYTVTTNAAAQTVNVSFTNIFVNAPVNTYLFLRLRVTSATNNMTTSNPTGYFSNGEVEDFRVNVNVVLPLDEITLNTKKSNNNSIDVIWNINNESQYAEYELQKSTNQLDWTKINTQIASGSNNSMTYNYTDDQQNSSTIYYRVKGISYSNDVKYSEIRKIDFQNQNSISVRPNPASSKATLTLKSVIAGDIQLELYDFSGRKVLTKTYRVNKGSNEINLPVQQLNNGLYKVAVNIHNEILYTTLEIIK